MRLLYVEDDPEARAFVGRGLRHRGFAVDSCGDGDSGFRNALTRAYDLIILDVMMAGPDGFSLLRRLRSAEVKTPVLFLSARAEAGDRIRGLDLGADDYLAKPFAFGELVARIRAVTRRGQAEPEDGRYAVADLVVDIHRHRVERAGHPIQLTAKPFAILEALIRSPGYVLSRSMILEKVWGPEFDALSNVIDVHIRALRKKVDADFELKLIHTVKGAGFVLENRGAPGGNGCA